MKVFKKDDRVILPGFQGEPARHGAIIDVYTGTPSGTGKTVVMYAVQWDGGAQSRGHLHGGRLELEPIEVTRTLGI